MEDRRFSAENLAAGYESDVISGVSFRIDPGMIMTVIGPNGGGKSTLLKTLGGLLGRRGGKVFLGSGDIDVLSGNERAKRISVMLTERINGKLMTCREVVEMGRYPYTGYFGVPSAADRLAADSAIRETRLEELADRDFSKLSDGQRQRVTLAMAICGEPDTLILDEPVSYLDICHKIGFLEIVKRLAAEKNMSVIMSMHELELAARISDLVLCVKDGGVYMLGSPEEVFRREVICPLFGISEDLFDRWIGNGFDFTSRRE
ncbi:MAG: ABC transporter ATP-binding protein [Ruminococcus sp.]|nr:ABC transporter ATP-binding protein [Ruminococcus sp.]